MAIFVVSFYVRLETKQSNLSMLRPEGDDCTYFDAAGDCLQGA